MNDPHTARYNGNNPDEPPRDTLGQPELPPQVVGRLLIRDFLRVVS